jgi:4-amino-4-deoxy-L-arabinose transferase-like glycosyltransferase
VTNRSTPFLILSACVLYILLGTCFIPYAGVQNDEALFSIPLYLFNPKDLSISIFHRHVPLMVMSYVGTLKTFLYAPILRICGANVWSVRLPMVLAGAATIYFFYNLARQAAGTSAAVLGSFLLATDPIFVLTDTFDWGPVALEHFLLVTGCLSLLRFAQSDSMLPLAGGFFFLGLALWNKAVFFWALGGLLFGATIVFRREVLARLTAGNFGIAAAAFLVGALPFVLYNVRHPNATLGSTAHFEAANFAPKFAMVRGAVNGSGLLGYLAMPDWADHPKPVSSRRGKVALWTVKHLGAMHKNLMEYAFVLALLAVPWWWRLRAAWFSLLFMAVTWTAMAVTNGAGGAIHHAVLLWPFPQFFIAVALASLPWPRMVAGGVAVLVLANLVVLSQYLLDFERDGASSVFSDALFPLSRAFADPNTAAIGVVEQPIYVMDWGMANTLALFYRGRLLVRPADGPFQKDSPSSGEREIIHAMLSDPNALFVDHVREKHIFPNVRVRLDRAVADAGYREVPLETISDSNGRPEFEIFRVR